MKNFRRGKNVALLGATGQLALAGIMLIVWRWAGSDAARACTLMLACGAQLWLMTALLLYCRQLAAREQEELSDLADSTSASMFEGGPETLGTEGGAETEEDVLFGTPSSRAPRGGPKFGEPGDNEA